MDDAPLPMPLMPACMGGWCAERSRCIHHLKADRRLVTERLCHRGQEMPAAPLVAPPTALCTAEQAAA